MTLVGGRVRNAIVDICLESFTGLASDDEPQRLGELAPGDREGARRDSVAPAFADANNNRSVAKGHCRKAAAQSVVWEMRDQGVLPTALGRFVCRRRRLVGTHQAGKAFLRYSCGAICKAQDDLAGMPSVLQAASALFLNAEP